MPETGNYFSQLGSKILSGEKFSYQNRKPLFEKVTKNISGNNFETISNGTQNYFFLLRNDAAFRKNDASFVSQLRNDARFGRGCRINAAISVLLLILIPIGNALGGRGRAGGGGTNVTVGHAVDALHGDLPQLGDGPFQKSWPGFLRNLCGFFCHLDVVALLDEVDLTSR